jgi:hypothetical protein
VTGVGRSLGAAVTGNRPLANEEVTVVVSVAALLAGLAVVGWLAPRLLAWPIAATAAWLALTFLVEAYRVWRRPDA